MCVGGDGFDNQLRASLTYFGLLFTLSHKRIVNNESVHQNEQHTSGMNTILYKIGLY